MFTLRPDLDAVLRRAREDRSDHPGMGWLGPPPPGAHSLHRCVDLPPGTSLEACGRALLDWQLHRAAGLEVRADGPAEPGTTVALGIRLGPVWALAPCRVIDVVNASGRIGFTYSTLAGHPELGVEQFLFHRDDRGARFEVLAVSMAAFWGSRLAPCIARRAQSAATDRYLRAALRLADDTLS